MRLPSPSPSFWVRLHATLIGVWIVMIIPALLWWSESVTFLVFISIYANIAGSIASWQAAHADCNSPTVEDLERVEARIVALLRRTAPAAEKPGA